MSHPRESVRIVLPPDICEDYGLPSQISIRPCRVADIGHLIQDAASPFPAELSPLVSRGPGVVVIVDGEIVDQDSEVMVQPGGEVEISLPMSGG